MLHIIKFGGTSLGSPERIRCGVSIIQERLSDGKTVAVVVSAFSGVTNVLIQLGELAAHHQAAYYDQFMQLCHRHREAAQDLNPKDTLLLQDLEALFLQLKTELEAIERQGKWSAKERDSVMSYGERLSVRIFASALRVAGVPAKSYDADALVCTNSRFGDADVDQSATSERTRERIGSLEHQVPVITGFIGANELGEITTLGRSGSDYTAGIMGEALGADVVEIWTDVDGVLTADPNLIANAVTIPRLNYLEMAEMAQFGTGVVHPRTVLPLKELKIPILIKNTLNPSAEGTLITHQEDKPVSTLRNVSLKTSIVLLGMRSKGLDKVRGFLGRALERLRVADIPVLYAASASAEFGFSAIIDDEHQAHAVQLLEAEFAEEYHAGLLDAPLILDDICMVTVIGDRLTNDIGLSGAVLSVLGSHHLAPISLARGAANRHLSLIMQKQDALKSVQLLNDHFCVPAEITQPDSSSAYSLPRGGSPSSEDRRG
jgi:aspartokinase/homoserine dehydrogenase 1